jgi:hypothetical protein
MSDQRWRMDDDGWRMEDGCVVIHDDESCGTYIDDRDRTWGQKVTGGVQGI